MRDAVIVVRIDDMDALRTEATFSVRVRLPDGREFLEDVVHDALEAARVVARLVDPDVAVDTLSFRVAGTPIPKGSKRAVPIRAAGKTTRIAVIEQPNVKAWEQTVREAAEEAAFRRGLTAPSNAAVEVEVTFTFPRPRGHYGTGRNHERLRAGAPRWPVVKPDVDKLARTILDGITGVLLTDDARVITLVARKTYGWPPGADIWLHWRQ